MPTPMPIFADLESPSELELSDLAASVAEVTGCAGRMEVMAVLVLALVLLVKEVISFVVRELVLVVDVTNAVVLGKVEVDVVTGGGAGAGDAVLGEGLGCGTGVGRGADDVSSGSASDCNAAPMDSNAGGRDIPNCAAAGAITLKRSEMRIVLLS